MKKTIVAAVCIIIAAGLLMTGCSADPQPQSLTLTDITGCELENCTEVFATYINQDLKRTFTDKADISLIVSALDITYTETEQSNNLTGLGEFEFQFKTSDGKNCKVNVSGNTVSCNQKAYTSGKDIDKSIFEGLSWYKITDPAPKAFKDMLKIDLEDVTEIQFINNAGTGEFKTTDKQDIKTFFEHMGKSEYTEKSKVTSLSDLYRAEIDCADGSKISLIIRESEIKIANTNSEYMFDKNKVDMKYFEDLNWSNN